MAKKFVDVTIGIYAEKHSVASCYQEEITPMKFYGTMECIKVEIKNNLSERLFIEKVNSGKIPDTLYVNVTVGEKTLINQGWSIYGTIDGKPSISDKIEINSESIKKLADSFATRIWDDIFHYIPKTKEFRYA